LVCTGIIMAMVARLLRRFILAFMFVAVHAPAFANSVTVTKHTSAPPADIAAPVKELLAPGGATAKVGDNTVEFWWVKTVPVTGDGEGFAHVAEGTLVGALRVAAPFRDIRGRVIKPGVYLLRYALQPQNGDHLGVSPFREFLLPTPAADDSNPAPAGHEGTVELAAMTTGISHPAVFSIDPPVATAAPLSVVQNEAGHTAVVFEVPTSKAPLKFGLILVGHIEA
jgi:hypothetical protein